jgi:type IV secretion system protein VirD4
MNGQEMRGFITLGVALVLVALYYHRRRWLPSFSSHGTARPASRDELKRAGMLDGKGLLLGRTLDKQASLIHIHRYVHLAIFAATGAGKGVSFLIPWLLTWARGSLAILDPKGELFQATAEKRRRIGQKVVRLDPFGVCGPGADTFNPLDLMGSGPDCPDDARPAAEAMVTRTGEEKDPHWNDQAANLITAMLAFILAALSGPERSLSALREIVTTPGMYEGCAKALMCMGGIFARLGGLMLTLEDKEKSGVISTVNRHTTYLDSAAIVAATASGWNARELLTGNVAVYIILPPHQLEAQSRWLRLVVSSLLRLVGREGMKHGKECLFLLDEAGQLGHMDPLEQGLTLLRASGLRMAFFFQSLGQLKEVFKEREAVLLDNTDQIYFGVQSLETAKRVSEMLGTYTESSESFTENTSRSQQSGSFGHSCPSVTRSSSWGTSVNVHSRELLKPDEVMQLPGTTLIAFLRGVRPVIARRVLYYSDPLFAPQQYWPLALKILAVAVTWAAAAYLIVYRL